MTSAEWAGFLLENGPDVERTQPQRPPGRPQVQGVVATGLFQAERELIKSLGGRLPTERLARPGIEGEGDGVEVTAGVSGKIGAGSVDPVV